METHGKTPEADTRKWYQKKRYTWSIIALSLVVIASSWSSTPPPQVESHASAAAPAAYIPAQPKAYVSVENGGTLSNNNYYTNSSGNSVHAPAYSDRVPEGASAECRDGTYSFSQHRQGTCSHHGGVADWL